MQPPVRPPVRTGSAGVRAGTAASGIGRVVRIILVVLVGAVGVFAGGAVAVLILAVTGDPSACVDRRIVPSGAAALEFTQKWDAFKAEAAATGQARTVFTELEATSRGVVYIAEKDAPIRNLQVYFCPDGHAEAKAKVHALGLSSTVVVRGTLDLSGDRPRIRIDNVQAGNVPAFLGRRMVDFALDQSDLRTLDISTHLIRLEYRDGEAALTGGR